MIRPELFKLRHHRTPVVLFGTMMASLSVAPIYYAIKNPSDVTDITGTYVGIFTIVAGLLAAVFGGWVVGHEFRQGTLRRVLGSDARRGRLIATKAAVGFSALIAGLSVAAGFGALASLASAASIGETLVWDGVVREVLGGAFLAVVVASIAFGLSVILRSDAYATIGSLGLMVIVGPLLGLIPAIGKYTPSQLTNDIVAWISNADETVVSIVPASLVLGATIGALSIVATTTFQRRDI
ncbi:MAG: ABC-type transport system involved in multi-copper enzyme maturation permease subunit [Ilumatobacter sp.]|jgi:ABC-type transport system involved in multi-copper enzyme maturation permease subunit